MDINGGMVPVLETPDGNIIHESAVIASFASDLHGQEKGLKIWPHEANPGDLKASMATAAMRLEMLGFDKIFGKVWGPFLSRFEDDEKIAAIAGTMDNLEAFVSCSLVSKNCNGKNFLSGHDEPMMIDFHCYPMLEMMVLLKDSPWQRGYEKMGVSKCEQIHGYVERMQKHPILGSQCRTQAAYDKLMAKWNTLEPGVKQ